MDKIGQFNNILDSFKINAQCIDFNEIDTYFYYDVKLHPRTKIKTIQEFADEIGLVLKAHSPMIKKNYEDGVIRIGFLKSRKTSFDIYNTLISTRKNAGNISCFIGESLYGEKICLNFENYPHLLVAGTTGSGKTVILHNIIANLAYNNSARMILVDPKNIEFSTYKPHVLQYLSTYKECVEVVNSLNVLMENTFKAINSGVRRDSIMPTFLIIDEFADLILQDRNEALFTELCKLAQKCRAARIHIVLATQRPSVDIIRGAIKANFPHRISCRVSSQVDSKVILDEGGAQNLLGKGDALIKDCSYNMERFQAGYISKENVVRLF